MKKKLLYTMITLAMSFSLVFAGGMSVFAALTGEGTSTAPYKITSVADLNEMQSLIAGEDAGGSHAKAYYQLTADIADAGSLTASIGTEEKSFQGSFDGNGYTISKLTKPLFAVTGGDSSVVKHLFLASCDISSSAGNVGALVGNATKTNISDCGVMGTVTSTGSGNVGGILGSATNVTLKNSYFNGKVVGESAAKKGIIVGNASTINATAVYYLPISGMEPQNGDTKDGMTSADAAAFKSGEVCHALQGSTSTAIWGQKLGTDATPFFIDSDSTRVWQVEVVDLDNNNKSTIKYVNDGSKLSLSAGTVSTVTAYADADKKTTFDYANTKITKDMKIYVTATAVTYTVTFNSNGGSSVASQTVAYGKTATKPTDPTRSGYTFGGWYKETALTNAWDFSTTITANTTLYAKWTASTAASSVKTGDSGTPMILYILLAVGAVGAATAGGVLLYRHFKFY